MLHIQAACGLHPSKTMGMPAQDLSAENSQQAASGASLQNANASQGIASQGKQIRQMFPWLISAFSLTSRHQQLYDLNCTCKACSLLGDHGALVKPVLRPSSACTGRYWHHITWPADTQAIVQEACALLAQEVWVLCQLCRRIADFPAQNAMPSIFS